MARESEPMRRLHSNPEQYEGGVEQYWHLRSLLANGQGPTDPVWRTFHYLQEFHLTLRRGDWDRWEDNKPLAINIRHYGFSDGNLELMRRDMEAALEADGAQELPYQPGSLGSLFNIMSNLKKLTISFETSEDKRDEMEAIVRWAETWRFEIMSWRHWMIRDNHEVVAHLVRDNTPVQKTSWRGHVHHWSDICPECNTHSSQPSNLCQQHRKRHLLLEQGKGPQLLVWSLTWRPQPVQPPISLVET